MRVRYAAATYGFDVVVDEIVDGLCDVADLIRLKLLVLEQAEAELEAVDVRAVPHDVPLEPLLPLRLLCAALFGPNRLEVAVKVLDLVRSR
jgi:hypothetical protein